MIRFFILLTMILLLTGVGMEGYGQVTYTTDGSGGWVRNPSTGGCTTITNHPTQNPLSGVEPTFNNRGEITNPGCKITIVINHSLTLASLNFGGNVEILVNSGASLQINGNVSVSSATQLNMITVNGGDLTINGNLILQNGSNSKKTNLAINIINNGSFNIEPVLGDEANTGLMNIGNEGSLLIDGDQREITPLTVDKFNLGIRSTVKINGFGGLLVKGDVDYRGNDSAINVEGFFRTEGSVIITGGARNQLNAFGSSTLVIEGNLDLRGDVEITLGGTSETDIGGDIIAVGSAKVIATEEAKVFVCGSFPAPCDRNNCNTQELIEGVFSDGCRLLPVEYSTIEVEYKKSLNMAVLNWITTKEWESSHFEIERAVKGVEFEKIGEVNATGWSDVLMQYTFEDSDLPLSATNILYRLKQVDLDGTFHYSKVLSVRKPGVQFTSGVWRAFPNPTLDNQLRISLLDRSQYDEEPITFRLVHPTAQSQAVAVKTEMEMNEQLSQMVARIPKGVFVVEIQWGQKIEHIKVMKQ